jgi:hypothetical protein
MKAIFLTQPQLKQPSAYIKGYGICGHVLAATAASQISASDQCPSL